MRALYVPNQISYKEVSRLSQVRCDSKNKIIVYIDSISHHEIKIKLLQLANLKRPQYIIFEI